MSTTTPNFDLHLHDKSPTGDTFAQMVDNINEDMGTLDEELYDMVTPKELSHANIDFSSADAQTIIAAQGVGKTIWIYSIELCALDNFEVALKDGASPIRTYRGCSVSGPSAPLPLSENSALVIQATTAERITGGVSYWVV
jgi:hypothetical protein